MSSTERALLDQMANVPVPTDVAKRLDRLKRQRERRKAREDALRSLGLVKVRGALGGTYWE